MFSETVNLLDADLCLVWLVSHTKETNFKMANQYKVPQILFTNWSSIININRFIEIDWYRLSSIRHLGKL